MKRYQRTTSSPTGQSASRGVLHFFLASALLATSFFLLAADGENTGGSDPQSPETASLNNQLQQAEANAQNAFATTFALRKELDAAHATIQSSQDDYSRLKAELETTKLALVNAQTQQEATNKVLAETRSALEAAKHEVQKASTEKEALGKEFALMQENSKSTRQELIALADQHQQLDAQLHETQLLGAKLEQETEQLKKDKQAAAASLADLRQQLSTAEESRLQLQSHGAKLEQEIEQLKKDKQAAAASIADLRQQLNTTEESRLQLQSLGAKLEQETEQLKKENQVAAASIADLRQQLNAAEGSRLQLQMEMESLQGRLPDFLGGTVTIDSLKERAQSHAQTMQEADKSLRKDRANQAAQTQLDAASQGMHAEQLMIAAATQASGIYRVRPEDTLGHVAGRMYGAGKSWLKIFAANQHVLKDENHLLPGMTLVVP